MLSTLHIGLVHVYMSLYSENYMHQYCIFLCINKKKLTIFDQIILTISKLEGLFSVVTDSTMAMIQLLLY